VIGRTLFRYMILDMLRALLVALSWLMLVGLLVVFLRTRFTDAGRLLGLRECLAGMVVVVPYLFGFLLPVALLAAVICSFGRLSADNELLAMRASGLSPAAVASAPLAAGLLASLLLLWLNVEGFRYAADKLEEMESSFQFSTAALTRPGTNFEVRRGNEKMIFSFLPRREDGTQPVRVARMTPGGESFQFLAGRYQCEISQKLNAERKPRRFVDFHLYDVQVVDPYRLHAEGRFAELHFTDLEIPGAISRTLIGGGPAMRSSLPENLAAARRRREQIRRVSRSLEARLLRSRSELLVSGAAGGDGWRALSTAATAARIGLVLDQLYEEIQQLRAEISRKVAFSFSPLFFALVGMGLGCLARKSSKLIGLGLGVLVAALYYGTWVAGKAMVENGLISPPLAPWIPNAITLAAGCWLATRQNRT
jgi:lipopolysaccharide export system permease protein